MDEAESDALAAYLRSGGARFVSSALLRAEAVGAGRGLGPEILAAVREGVRGSTFVAIDDSILETAGMLDPTILRTLDAIHLATALALGDDLQAVVTHDARIVAAASAEGVVAASPR